MGPETRRRAHRSATAGQLPQPCGGHQAQFEQNSQVFSRNSMLKNCQAKGLLGIMARRRSSTAMLCSMSSKAGAEERAKRALALVHRRDMLAAVLCEGDDNAFEQTVGRASRLGHWLVARLGSSHGHAPLPYRGHGCRPR